MEKKNNQNKMVVNYYIIIILLSELQKYIYFLAERLM